VILDTDGLSAIADGDAALEPTLRKAAKVAVPAIVLGEYRYFTCKVHAQKSDKCNSGSPLNWRTVSGTLAGSTD
jgi:hypothetical protein